MKSLQSTFTIPTNGSGLTEFTSEIAHWLDGVSVGDGLLTLFVQHTSCSLLIQENADPEVKQDLNNFFQRLVPYSDHPSMSYLTHTYEGHDDMPAHIRAALLPTSLSIPVQSGKMRLGTWQGLYLFEHRDGLHHRHVAAHFS